MTLLNMWPSGLGSLAFIITPPPPPGPQWTTISHTCVRSSMYEHCVTEGPEAGLLSMY